MNVKVIAIGYAIIAAVFYAVNTPISKILLEYIPVTFMASFLYLGAGIGVGIMYLFHFKKEDPTERLVKSDLPYTIGMIVLDIAAPIFMMLGIKLGTASNASLLGNFEIVSTTLIALLIFKEVVTKRLWFAIALIALSSTILSFEGDGSFTFSFGSLFVLLATLCWGLENNCTRKISEKSTHQIVVLKGIFSGLGSFVIAFIVGESLPDLKFILIAMATGYVAYGLSIFTYIRAQRYLGAAKTSAFYAVAPFLGAILSLVFLGERLNLMYTLALLFMVAGTVFTVWDTLIRSHAHRHHMIVTHVHNGMRHTHYLEHNHEHSHVFNGMIHKHGHTKAEIDELLKREHQSK